MSKLRVHCFSVSLDGYGAGPNQNLDNPLGVGGVALHEWLFGTRTFQQMVGKNGGTTGIDKEYETTPAIREACERSITGHAATLEADIEAAMRERNMAPDWTAKSLALHTQAVIQGAFILAKATGGAEIAADSIDHMHSYIEMLFGVGTEQAKHLTDGDSK
jgi:hypothetical protein